MGCTDGRETLEMVASGLGGWPGRGLADHELGSVSETRRRDCPRAPRSTDALHDRARPRDCDADFLDAPRGRLLEIREKILDRILEHVVELLPRLVLDVPPGALRNGLDRKRGAAHAAPGPSRRDGSLDPGAPDGGLLHDHIGLPRPLLGDVLGPQHLRERSAPGR